MLEMAFLSFERSSRATSSLELSRARRFTAPALGGASAVSMADELVAAGGAGGLSANFRISAISVASRLISCLNWAFSFPKTIIGTPKLFELVRETRVVRVLGVGRLRLVATGPIGPRWIGLAFTTGGGCWILACWTSRSVCGTWSGLWSRSALEKAMMVVILGQSGFWSPVGSWSDLASASVVFP
ncbi:hypothetical protein MRX96_034745 [Rhipicephalus microplus]